MNTPLSQCQAWLGITQYSAAFQAPGHGVHWVGRQEVGKQGGGRQGAGKEGGLGKKGGNKREGGREAGRQAGREGGRTGWREEAMMLGRPRASVEEGMAEGEMVDEGKERGRDGAWTVGGRKWAEKGLSEQGREISREVSWGGHWPVVKYSQTIPQGGPCHWYFVITNEKYWTCINYKLCVLFVRRMTWFHVMAIMAWVHMAWTRCIIGNPSEAG